MPVGTEIILQHGWGFDGSAFDSWHQSSPPHVRLHTLDRGYFGLESSPASIELSPGSRRVLVTHSLGLHFIPRNLAHDLTMLVIIGGFEQFHPCQNRLRLLSQKAVAAMLSKIESNATQVLCDFYARCFQPDGNPVSVPTQMDKTKLKEDLIFLDQHALDIEAVKAIPRVLILHGVKDEIVDSSKAAELHTLLPASTLRVHDSAGHALPFVQHDWCLNSILDFLKQEKAPAVAENGGRS